MRTTLLALILATGCAPDDPPDPIDTDVPEPAFDGCSVPGDLEDVMLDYGTRVVMSSWMVTDAIDTQRTLSFGISADLLGGLTTVNTLHLIGWCDEPMTFAPTCQESGMAASTMCIEVACDGYDAATTHTWLTAGAVEAPYERLVYPSERFEGEFVYALPPTMTWSVDPTGEGNNFSMDGRFAGEAVWRRDAGDVNLSYRTRVTAARVDGEVGAISGQIDWPWIEPDASWSFVFVDDVDGIAGTVLREGVEVATIVDAPVQESEDHWHWNMGIEWPGDCP